jgi:hypothetical protein
MHQPVGLDQISALASSSSSSAAYRPPRSPAVAMRDMNDGEGNDYNLLSCFTEEHDISPRPLVCTRLGLGFSLIWDFLHRSFESSNVRLKSASPSLI